MGVSVFSEEFGLWMFDGCGCEKCDVWVCECKRSGCSCGCVMCVGVRVWTQGLAVCIM